jgi:hypothetical protein
MVTLLIEHRITDFATWRDAFGRFEGHRRTSGVQREHVYQPVDDPHYVLITLDFAEDSQAASFLGFLRSQVWTNPAASPALDDDAPRTVILHPAP